MTIHTPKHLTSEELASLIKLALTTSASEIPPANLAKLIALGYVAVMLKGPVVTGDGLMRIMESE
jgi:hypothetical protein